jgi:hypothetical protein
MTSLCSSAAAIDERAHRDPPDDHEHRQHIEHLDDPVAPVRVGERRHWFAAERR